jgi:hypothetical protein
VGIAVGIADERQAAVLRIAEYGSERVEALLRRFGMQLTQLAPGTAIPGSYWGESEAGLVGSVVYVRSDTPLHSVLHEACHFICMDPVRRRDLERDAGGDDAEENAVCYLQILLADALADVGRYRMWSDMDEWGYTFRLGSAQRWFEQDADDARCWLIEHRLIDARSEPTWKCREDEATDGAVGSLLPQHRVIP